MESAKQRGDNGKALWVEERVAWVARRFKRQLRPAHLPISSVPVQKETSELKDGEVVPEAEEEPSNTKKKSDHVINQEMFDMSGTCERFSLLLLKCCLTKKHLSACLRRPIQPFVVGGIVACPAGFPGQDQKSYEDMTKLEINDYAINKLYYAFQCIDDDHSGEISLGEFHQHLNLDETHFSRKVFALLDEDGSGEIDFREFVLATWNYCTFTSRALAEFAFSLFDNDDSGTLEKGEIEILVEAVYGGSSGDNVRVQRTLDLLDSNGDEVVSKEEFVMFNQQQPLLLFPAYQMQETLRSGVLGAKWWQKMADVRFSKFRNQNIFEILEKMDQDTEYKNRKIAAMSGSFEEDIDNHPLRGLKPVRVEVKPQKAPHKPASKNPFQNGGRVIRVEPAASSPFRYD